MLTSLKVPRMFYNQSLYRLNSLASILQDMGYKVIVEPSKGCLKVIGKDPKGDICETCGEELPHPPHEQEWERI